MFAKARHDGQPVRLVKDDDGRAFRVEGQRSDGPEIFGHLDDLVARWPIREDDAAVEAEEKLAGELGLSRRP